MKRPAAVAGLFYPDDPGALRAQVEELLRGVGPITSVIRARALIAPHAGLVYSGPVAATGYAHLDSVQRTTRRIVLLGPSHRVAFHGLAAPTADWFATPMGDVPVDREALGRLVAESPQVQWLDEAHRREHSLEMHLPFLLKKFNMIPVVPLVVGGATAEEVAAVLEQLWSDDTLFVVSSDLSHFHDYETAKRVDGETTRRLERLAFDELDGDRACGFYPLRGLLLAARRKGLGLRTVDLRSSGDTAGSRREVVGYGSYLLG